MHSATRVKLFPFLDQAGSCVVEGFNCVMCSGLYYPTGKECVGEPTYKKDLDGIVRFLYYQCGWQISNANCDGRFCSTLVAVIQCQTLTCLRAKVLHVCKNPAPLISH